MARALTGKIAIVTGGSRGVGKGIALELGEAGATVYVTGRTVETGMSALPGTILQTAQQVTQRGGQGIAVRCDHGCDSQVEALFRRVQQEQGRLDLLVNNAFDIPAAGMPNQGPFWELPIGVWDQMQTVGLRSHYVASVYAAPIMVAQRRGLIIHISSVGAVCYLFSAAYGAGKAGVDKMAADMAHELRPYDVAAISLWPGRVNTERFIAQAAPADLRARESPQLTGRAVAALAADPRVMEKTGWTLSVAELAKEYGFTDLDGSCPQVPPEVAALRTLREWRA
jgi:dehydrogenase/reductase SDR family member 1